MRTVKNLSSVKCNTDFILRTVCVDRKRKRAKKGGCGGEKGGGEERQERGSIKRKRGGREKMEKAEGQDV